MKKLVISLAILAAAIFSVQAQDVLLEEQVSETVVESKFGPNRLHYANLFMNFGLSPLSHANQGYKKNSPWSFDFQLGVRYKIKLHNYYALGAQLYFGSTDHYIRYDEEANVNNHIIYDSEYFSLGGWGFEIYQRINFDKRGNTLGKFIDLGGFVEWLPCRSQTLTIEQDESSLFEEQTLINNKLKYVNDYAYGVTARLGYNSWAIYAKYRLSELVNDQISEATMGFDDFSPLSLGVSISF